MLVVRRAVVGPFAANAYLAACDRTGETVIIDPGGDTSRVLGMCEPGGFRVARIFCTHGHPDHVGGTAEAKARTGAPVSLHAADEPWIEEFPKIAALHGLEPIDDVRFHAGHGAGGLVGDERRLNPFAGEPARRGRFP